MGLTRSISGVETDSSVGGGDTLYRVVERDRKAKMSQQKITERDTGQPGSGQASSSPYALPK